MASKTLGGSRPVRYFESISCEPGRLRFYDASQKTFVSGMCGFPCKCHAGYVCPLTHLIATLGIRSPDLNPVEKVWAHLRKHLRAMDLKDVIAKRPLLTKEAYRERVRRVLTTKRFQRLAANCAMSLRQTCRLVLQNQGRACRG